MNEKKIFKVFYDPELEKLNLGYKFVYAITEPYDIKSIVTYSTNESNNHNLAGIITAIKNTIQNNLDISGVFIKYDLEAIITTAVLEEFKLNVKFPSFESVFLSHHKYYGRMYERNPIKFSYIDIFEELDENKIGLPFPFYLKPPDLQVSVHQYIVHNFEQLKEIIKILQKELPTMDKEYKLIYKNYLDLAKYPLANKFIVVIEEIVEDGIQVNWEGFMDDTGKFYTFSVTDEIFADKNKHIFSDFVMKTNCSDREIAQIEKMCSEFLQDTNFINGFTNVELWVRPNGDIQIIEANPRCAYPYYQQYLISYNVNLYHSVIKLSMGQLLDNLPNNANFAQFSTTTVIATKLNGRIRELIDLDVIRKLEESGEYTFTLLNCEPDFEIVNNVQNNGRVLLRIYYGRSTFAGIISTSRWLKESILLKDDYYKLK